MTKKYLKIDFSPLIARLDYFTKRFASSNYTGGYSSLFKQKGIEFEDYRLFVAGDDASLIDWRASKRSGKILVREYMQTRALNAFIMVDISNSMVYSSHDKLKCEYAAEVAASMAHFFLKEGNAVGMLLFNERVKSYIPPKSGKDHFTAMTRVLSNPDYYGGNFDFAEPFQFIHSQAPNPSLIFIISDFIGLKKTWQAPFKLLTQKADVVSMIIRDPQDMELSSRIGTAVIEDPFSPKVMAIEIERVRENYKFHAKKRLRSIRTSLQSMNIESVVLPTDDSFFNSIVNFFAERKHRWQ